MWFLNSSCATSRLNTHLQPSCIFICTIDLVQMQVDMGVGPQFRNLISQPNAMSKARTHARSCAHTHTHTHTHTRLAPCLFGASEVEHIRASAHKCSFLLRSNTRRLVRISSRRKGGGAHFHGRVSRRGAAVRLCTPECTAMRWKVAFCACDPCVGAFAF
jgi:hypothetical protein